MVEREEIEGSIDTSSNFHSWIERCAYRGEGNANLVVALPKERKVIRLRKLPLGSESMLKKAEESVRREVEFIRLVISGYLGTYVSVPEIISCEPSDIARLSEKIRPARPDNRKDKDIVGGYATKYPDYTYLPDHLSAYSTKSTFCVEIKPKQGFVCEADRLFKKCPYCLTQYYKIQNGSAKRASDYCPFDLFSGDENRMNRALKALLRSPQNNLKIFKDGVVVYDESSLGFDDDNNVLDRLLGEWFACCEEDTELALDYFLQMLGCALTRPFDDKRYAEKVKREVSFENGDVPSRLKSELVDRVKALLRLDTNEECEVHQRQLSTNDKELTTGSVLERILRMQRLHRCGADVVAWIYARLAETTTRLDDELIYAELCKKTSSYNGGDPAVVASVELRGIDDTFHVKDKKNKHKFDWLISNQKKSTLMNDLYKKNSCNEQKKQNHTDYEFQNQKFLKDLTIEDCLNILKNYLLFCTAKDCSILIAFQEVNKKLPLTISPDHQIHLNNNQSFLVNVRVLDLDIKSLTCIQKHCRRDNDVLRATIKELEKKLNL